MWKDLNELVSLMERNPSCSMETLVSDVNHGYARGLVKRFQVSERMRRREIYIYIYIYIMLAERKKVDFLMKI